jgi:K+-transporting ATPase KdpF subunit
MSGFATAPEEKQMFDYTLGAIAVLIIVIYLGYALMRPEQF